MTYLLESGGVGLKNGQYGLALHQGVNPEGDEGIYVQFMKSSKLGA